MVLLSSVSLKDKLLYVLFAITLGRSDVYFMDQETKFQERATQMCIAIPVLPDLSEVLSLHDGSWHLNSSGVCAAQIAEIPALSSVAGYPCVAKQVDQGGQLLWLRDRNFGW